jgi:hypothetical protein
MKKLFKSYSCEFNKNEKKIITAFCRQAVKQLASDSKNFADYKAYSSILDKITESSESVKFTKDEYNRLGFQLRENVKRAKQKMEKSGFFTRWIHKSLYIQYNNIVTSHFSD